MNKYLTILLVVLTATGSEAQTLTSALNVPCGNMRFEQMLTPEQLRAMGTDIMSVLKVLQIGSEDHKSHPFYNNSYIILPLTACHETISGPSDSVDGRPQITRSTFVGTAVSIRAPSI